MGQYYKPCFINGTKDKVKEYFESWDANSGSKLMEHSYVGNALVLNVSYKMINSPKRLVWAGDYADEVIGDDNFFYLTDKANKVEPLDEIDMMKRALDSNSIYINHDKKEWFDLKSRQFPILEVGVELCILSQSSPLTEMVVEAETIMVRTWILSALGKVI